MRRILLTTSLFLMPQLAIAGQCPVPAPQDNTPSPAVIVPDVPGPVPPRPLSEVDISQSPALQRISSRGASLWEIGDVTTNHGLRGIFARNGQSFRTFYLTPDLQAEVGGVMWDANGHNITRDTVAMIPGVIPTVKWTPGQSGKPDQTIGQTEGHEASSDATKIMATAAYGIFGTEKAPRLYLVVDPLCPYSIRALQSLEPYVDKGALQLAIVPIAINDYENNNNSTPAAQAMLSVGQKQMIDVWRQIITLNHAPADRARGATSGMQLQLNLQKAHMIGLRGTPTIVWRDRNGKAHVQSGLPDNLDSLIVDIAP